MIYPEDTDDRRDEDEDTGCRCPLGGDENDDCADCAYAADYHYSNGKCVPRRSS